MSKSWGDAKVILPGRILELRLGKRGGSGWRGRKSAGMRATEPIGLEDEITVLGA
jgi:hypothetical protein